MGGEGEDRRGEAEAEACWLAGPGKHEVGAVGVEQREGRAEV